MASAHDGEGEDVVLVFKDVLGLCQNFLLEGRALFAEHPNISGGPKKSNPHN